MVGVIAIIIEFFVWLLWRKVKTALEKGFGIGMSDDPADSAVSPDRAMEAVEAPEGPDSSDHEGWQMNDAARAAAKKQRRHENFY